MKNKKVYRLWDKEKNKYVSNGQNYKSQWNSPVWPYNRFLDMFAYSPKDLINKEMDNYEVHECELVVVNKEPMTIVHIKQQEKKQEKESKLQEIENIKKEIRELVNSDHLNFPAYTIVSMYNVNLFKDDVREKLTPLIEKLLKLEKNF